jgi:hypothetical protein
MSSVCHGVKATIELVTPKDFAGLALRAGRELLAGLGDDIQAAAD